MFLLYKPKQHYFNEESVSEYAGIIRNWKNCFTPDSRVQPELISLYKTSKKAFYLYADVDYYSYAFNLYKINHANLYTNMDNGQGILQAKEYITALSSVELFNLPLLQCKWSKEDWSQKGESQWNKLKMEIIGKGNTHAVYGCRDLGGFIDSSEWAFNVQWAWQVDRYKSICKEANLRNLSADEIESLWLEFAHQRGLISHKSPSPRRVDWVY